MNCKRCGAPIPESSFKSGSCFYCGGDPSTAASDTVKRVATPAAPAPIIAFFGVLVGLGAATFFLLRDDEPPPDSTGAQEAPAPVPSPVVPAWRGTETLRCAGDEVHTLKGAQVSLDAQLIQATGACKVTLDECFVTTKGGAIQLRERASLTIKGGRIEAGGDAIMLDGDAQLHVTDAEIVGAGYAVRIMGGGRATVARGRLHSSSSDALRVDARGGATLDSTIMVGGIDARDEAEIALKLGSVKGHERGRVPFGGYAIRVDANAVVTLLGTTLEGEISSFDAGVVVKLTPGDDVKAVVAEQRERARNISRYEKIACDGLLDCYVDNGSFGTVDAHVVMPIGPDGRVIGATVQRAGGANPTTRQCIDQVARSKVIDEFKGPPGALVCQFSGQLQSGVRMLSISGTYEPTDKPRASPVPPP